MNRARRTTYAGLSSVLLVTLAACGGSATQADSKGADSATTDSASTVHLKLLQFNPNTLTVKAGSKVTFVNDEVITHTVTTGTFTLGEHDFRSTEMKDGKLDTTLKGKGDAVSYTFAAPGTYTYFCTIHKAMQAEIVVQ